MKVFHYSSDPSPGANQRPFAMQFQSKSPVLGCLLALGVLVVGGLLALGAGVLVLIAPVGLLLWRVVKAFLPEPTANVSEQNHPTPGVIDVDATVLPPSIEGERRPVERDD